MPCNDVTELLRLRLDEEDRLVGYALLKRTCGRAVGEQSLLEDEMRGRPAEDLLAQTADTFADAHPIGDDVEMFLHLKHFFALQAGLKAVLGLEGGGISDPVRIARVAYEDGEVILDAELVVDIITEQIKSCGRCKGCGAAAKMASNR